MLEALKREVCDCNKALPSYHLVVMTSGTVSARDPESGLIVVKPSGYPYEIMTPADMVVVDPAGKVIEGHLIPSVDLNTHLVVYRLRKDVQAVVHTHSPYASIFAVLGKPIVPCLTAQSMISSGEIPLGGLKLIGGEDIGNEIVDKIGDSKAIIMQSHGIYTIGTSAREALKMAVEVEEIAKIMAFASCMGQPMALDAESIALTRQLYVDQYGQKASSQ